MKQKVAAGEPPWKQAWENLLAQPYSAMDFEPQPFVHIMRGAYGRSAAGDRQLSASANAAYSQALQWYVTGDRAHARKAIEILNAWSGTLWDFDGNDAKLLAGWTGGTFCNAAEILRATDPGWTAKEVEQFKRLMLTVYYPLLKDFFPEANGNWDAAIEDTLVSIGIFCDDRAIFNRAVEHFRRGSGNGGITRYIYTSGQCDENTRDQGHTQLGLGYFALAARAAWSQGIDLYSTAGDRLALGFEFTARYMLGEDVAVYGIINPTGRGRFSDIYESIYQHYHFGKGFEMPYTERAVERARTTGWTALTMYRGPSGPPVKTAALSANRQAGDAGALDGPTARPPAGAAVLAPGDPIQPALDARAASDGGWVVLSKGVYTLPAALRIPSGITLAGQGRATVLFLDPKQTGPAIVNASPDLHDVTLRDFLLEGGASTQQGSDPNQDRRMRSYQNVPTRAGILFNGARAGGMHNIRLEHVTVRHCTHQGVAIRGASQVLVAASHFDENGGSVVPGPGLQHNLLLTRVVGVMVTDSRMDRSPSGSGIDVSNSRDVTISSNELARNGPDGLHVTEGRNIRADGNLAEGNDGGGIVADALMDGNDGVAAKQNVCRNNGGPGLAVSGSRGAVVEANMQVDNGGKAGARVSR